jgi:hypothetical protein
MMLFVKVRKKQYQTVLILDGELIIVTIWQNVLNWFVLLEKSLKEPSNCTMMEKVYYT